MRSDEVAQLGNLRPATVQDNCRAARRRRARGCAPSSPQAAGCRARPIRPSTVVIAAGRWRIAVVDGPAMCVGLTIGSAARTRPAVQMSPVLASGAPVSEPGLARPAGAAVAARVRRVAKPRCGLRSPCLPGLAGAHQRNTRQAAHRTIERPSRMRTAAITLISRACKPARRSAMPAAAAILIAFRERLHATRRDSFEASHAL